MKRVIIPLLLSVTLLVGCAEHKTIKGVTYLPYGLVNQDEQKNPEIAYEIPVENIVAGVIFCETIIVPIYIIGWDLYQPVGIKPAIKGREPVEVQ